MDNDKKPKFEFNSRSLTVDALNSVSFKGVIDAPDKPHCFYVLTDALSLLLVNLGDSTSRCIAILDESEFPKEASFQLVICPRGRYMAITRIFLSEDKNCEANKGAVFDLVSGEEYFLLRAEDYRMEHTPFPVCFIEHQGKTLLIHATDWDRLDITDLETKNLITKRDFDEIPDRELCDNYSLREWLGQLIPSPSNARLATIGWVWHPFGVAYGFDLARWLDGSIWETDVSEHTRTFSGWEYYWDSPFLWIDDTRLCIWAAEATQDYDIPENSATIFNAETEEEVLIINGPTQDIFFFDEFLFSGIADHGEAGEGLSIWDVNDGEILYENHDIQADLYLRTTKEIIAFKEDGEIVVSSYTVSRG